MHSNEEFTKIYTGGSTEELKIYSGGGPLEIHRPKHCRKLPLNSY